MELSGSAGPQCAGDRPGSPPEPRRWGAAEWRILALAAAVRFVWAVVVPMVPVSDSEAYDLGARNLAAGYGYCFEPGTPTAYWPVGTSAVCAALYKTFGHDYTPIVAVNLLVGVATAALMIHLAGAWFGAAAGRLAGLSLALWPGQIEFTTILASELWFNAACLVWLFTARRGGPRSIGAIVVGGLALAAATYIRPLSLPLPFLLIWIRLVDPAAPASFWRTRSGLKTLALETLITFTVMGAVIAPWSIRNMNAFGRFVLVSTNGGANLWMGNNPASAGGYMPLPESAKAIANEAERDEFLKREAVDYIKRDPGAFVKRVAVRLVQTHLSESIGYWWNEKGLKRIGWDRAARPIKILNAAYWWGMLGLAAFGLAVLGRSRGIAGFIGNPAVVLWVFFAVVHAIIVGGDRYHYPSVPAIAALAGLGAAEILRRRGASSPPGSAPLGPDALSTGRA